MTVLDQVREYYHANRTKLNQILGETSFHDVTEQYTNSVVIRFENGSFTGEISVWNNSSRPYLECEALDLTNTILNPFYLHPNISTVTSQDELHKAVETLKSHMRVNTA
jgi:hypothetical protein